MSRAEEAELLRRYLPFIAGFFRSRVASPEDAEDLTQEAAVAVTRSWPRFAHRSAVTTWIYAICRNTLCAHVRRSGRLPSGVPLGDPPAPRADEIDHLAVELALERMDPQQRKLYELRYRLGLPVREIAALLAKPEGTVKYELYRLRAEARRLLG